MCGGPREPRVSDDVTTVIFEELCLGEFRLDVGTFNLNEKKSRDL